MKWQDYIGTLDQVFEEALESPRERHFATRKLAKAYRHRLYRFRLSVRDAAMDGDVFAKALYQRIRCITIRIAATPYEVSKALDSNISGYSAYISRKGTN